MVERRRALHADPAQHDRAADGGGECAHRHPDHAEARGCHGQPRQPAQRAARELPESVAGWHVAAARHHGLRTDRGAVAGAHGERDAGRHHTFDGAGGTIADGNRQGHALRDRREPARPGRRVCTGAGAAAWRRGGGGRRRRDPRHRRIVDRVARPAVRGASARPVRGAAMASQCRRPSVRRGGMDAAVPDGRDRQAGEAQRPATRDVGARVHAALGQQRHARPARLACLSDDIRRTEAGRACRHAPDRQRRVGDGTIVVHEGLHAGRWLVRHCHARLGRRGAHAHDESAARGALQAVDGEHGRRVDPLAVRHAGGAVHQRHRQRGQERHAAIAIRCADHPGHVAARSEGWSRRQRCSGRVRGWTGCRRRAGDRRIRVSGRGADDLRSRQRAGDGGSAGAAGPPHLAAGACAGARRSRPRRQHRRGTGRQHRRTGFDPAHAVDLRSSADDGHARYGTGVLHEFHGVRRGAGCERRGAAPLSRCRLLDPDERIPDRW